MRDFPKLIQKSVDYRRIRSGEGPSGLSSAADQVARVHKDPQSPTWGKRFSAIQLFLLTWKKLVEENPLKFKKPMLTLHLAAIQVLEHTFPTPRLLPVYLALYLQALRSVLEPEAPIKDRVKDSPIEADIVNLQHRFSIQAARLLRPAQPRRVTPLISWWAGKGYDRMEAKILASMTADAEELQRIYPDAVRTEIITCLRSGPLDLRLQHSAVVFVEKMLNRWCHFSLNHGELEVDPEYIPTAFLPVSLGSKEPGDRGAFETMVETRMLQQVRFSQAARTTKKKSAIQLDWVEICSGGITHKLRKMACYTGYKWASVMAGIADRDALVVHAKYVQALEDIYGTDPVRDWYFFLYITRRLLLREDNQLDIRAKLLSFCLTASTKIDRALGRCFPSRIESLKPASRCLPKIDQCADALNHIPRGEARNLCGKILWGGYHDGWNLKSRMRLIKGFIEGSFSVSKLETLRDLASRFPPSKVLPHIAKTLIRVQDERQEVRDL